MKTDFLGGFYQSRSPVLGAQSCVNLYLESNETENGEEGALYGRPGLLALCQLADETEVRGMRVMSGNLFAVCGPSVYRIDANFNATLIGTLPNTSGLVSMTDNGTQLLISHQGGWHYATLTGKLTAVTDPDQPRGALLTEQDGYVIFTAGGALFGLSGIDDVTSVDPLDVASVEGAPDNIVNVISDHLQVWIPCQYITEIWEDTGNNLFPYERIAGGLLEVGCAAARSLIQLDDSLAWLAQNRTGSASVIRTNAYRPSRISTFPIEHAFESYARFDDAIGFSFQIEGHAFYMLILPTADDTFVYDCATKLWYQWPWMDSLGRLHRHRANCYAFFNGQHIVGDWENGKLYAMDLDTYTDDGGVIYHERAWPIPDAERHKVRTDRVELLLEAGVGRISGMDSDPQVWLQVSYDGGKTFGYKRYQPIGVVGKRTRRPVWRRLGMGRQTVLRVATTSTNKVAWIGANIDAEVVG